MRTQQEREEQSAAIASALGLFAIIVMAVGLVTWGLLLVSDVVDGREEAVMGTAILVAGIVAFTKLARSERP